MIEFFASYIWLAIGALVTILGMILGEIEINSTTGKIWEDPVYQHFPVTAHLTIVLFILVFCLVIMNLLVGLAVSDIHLLMKDGKRRQLLARVELISFVETFRKTKLFRFLPGKLQTTMKR